MIYCDNNDSTKMHPEVLEAMLPWFKDSYGNPASLHSLGLEAESAVDAARASVAESLGVSAGNIVFTGSATEANNLAIMGAAAARPDRRHVIISAVEHSSVTNHAKRLEKEGWRLTVLPVDGQGYVSLDALSDAVDDQTFLVSVVLANHEVGTIQDLAAIAEIAHTQGAWVHTDAAQAPGKMPVNLADLGVDLASFNGHKIHGPKGVGALFFNKKTRPRRLMEGAPQEHDLRPGTENVPGIVGFAKALEIAVRDREEVEKLVRPMQIRLAEGLAQIPHVRLNGPPPTERLLGNLNITFLYIEGEAILMHLSNRGICVSSGSACSSKSLVPSNVLTAMGLLHEEAHGAIRYSLSRFNRPDEVDEVIKRTGEVVELLRSMTAFVPELHSERAGGTSFYRKR